MPSNHSPHTPARSHETPGLTALSEVPPSSSSPATTAILGIPLAQTDYEGTIDWIDDRVARREPSYVCVAAVHTVMACQEDEALREAVLNSSLTVPDGKPLVWAMNSLGDDLEGRVYGPDLMARYCAHAARSKGPRMYLYGGRNQGALVQLTLELRRRYPGLQIVGGYSPPYRDLTEAEEATVTDEINRSGADLVWVGIGVPKQEKWMARMRDRLDPPVLIGVGAAFDFHARIVPQAPTWIQDLGMEWMYRLMHEPRRLGRRYFRYNPLFVRDFARQYARHRVGPSQDR